MFSSEKDLENASLYEPSGYVGVVFLDSSATSYRLRYPHNQLPLPSDYTESFGNLVSCRAANYWYSGFIRLQTVIDATIIQMQTKRSVWNELQLRVEMMGQPASVEVQKFSHALISIYLVLAFTPFVTFLIVNVVAEKEQRLKDTMTMMGLYDTAFWLSWGLLYAALVTTMSILMAVIATYTALFPNSSFLILLLDEPTAGMDPCSRHQVWTLLKNRRAGRVTVLSTHYMDEADILADRKAVISQGQLRCVGSSLYLKTKCGVGYHLRMSVSESCKAESVTLLVNQHVPKAKLSRQQDTELTFTLPFENVDTFPDPCGVGPAGTL
ncbi:hypothetical protein CRUP_015431 [Coryphaenoides rupestris]|nr:hypothetical protein CRUP_015431 [Coryphaenoides rupestris]